MEKFKNTIQNITKKTFINVLPIAEKISEDCYYLISLIIIFIFVILMF